ncbi:bacillithiol biosynthesis cysteine-adding enzyme BshC [Bacillus ectoiniformans]|uniref:bacillithiol biosynthesis cysteine-adding enzyme BshC n=1 Tax=Bacillus ectoiniformans TaxID=1494429 RepID=UPI00195610CB|nr:bacillithiol biosynthesis cysteine-adding enzyme BshC [Bacillus ectoiniformans]MBM7647227.1 bacillithiol biosynthesis cysteine-adding enzyme BshC [Bacillus ectoiniformans]
MQLERLFVPAINRFASQYTKQEAPVTEFFHYNLAEKDLYINRVADLKKRNFMRQPLADCVASYMKAFPASEAVNESIQKLKDERSAVVIGGQQAGLLTGPLYTIHKIISIIHLAKQQEKQLDIPVVPVFWIAGEDHDFLEVNHVFAEEGTEMVKKGYPERVLEKKMVSDIEFDPNEMKRWVEEIFSGMEETKHTNPLLETIYEAIDQHQTVTGFFSALIHSLFQQYGLLLIDAAYPPLRKLESAFFKELMNHAEEITDAVLTAQKNIASYEFKPAIELSRAAANLFIYKDQERMLLEYDQGVFKDKQGTVSYTKEELGHLLDESPELFSNNVVTRPLMQEWLFPTLAFIAGPGEIAYWAELQKAFELFDMKIPPIEARLNMTVVERPVKRELDRMNLSLDSALINGVEKEKHEFWLTVKDEHFHEMIESLKETLEKQYAEIEERAKGLHRGLAPIIEKNMDFHLNQLNYLQDKTDQLLKEQHESVLNRYARIQNALRPNGGPQERTWNIYYYLNKYGSAFMDDLINLDYQFTGEHQIIHL